MQQTPGIAQRGEMGTVVDDEAHHPIDLVQGDRLWINLDRAQQGIGSASCGPGVLPAYRLDPAPVTFSVLLDPLPGDGSIRSQRSAGDHSAEQIPSSNVR